MLVCALFRSPMWPLSSQCLWSRRTPQCVTKACVPWSPCSRSSHSKPWSSYSSKSSIILPSLHSFMLLVAFVLLDIFYPFYGKYGHCFLRWNLGQIWTLFPEMKSRTNNYNPRYHTLFVRYWGRMGEWGQIILNFGAFFVNHPKHVKHCVIGYL